MSKRSRNRHRRQEAAQQAEPARQGPKPIKVLAIGVGILLIIIAAVNIFIGSLASGSSGSTSTTTSAGNTQQVAGTLTPTTNGVQEVAISMRGYQYQPNPVRVKVGVPVRFTVDLNSVRGCMRSIRIPDLGVSGRVTEGSNTIEFTPTKAGTFRMTCSMGMADGTIIVEDANGNAPAAVPSAAPARAAGACGSGGGCGCGG